MNNQPPLPLFETFTKPSKPAPIAKRHSEMRRVEKEADSAWKQAYEAFILRFAETHSGFSAEDVREAFNQT